jgi:hypothetical protein
VGARTPSSAFWTHHDIARGMDALSGRSCLTSVPIPGWSNWWGRRPVRAAAVSQRRSGRRCFIWSGRGGGKCKRHVPECRPREGSVNDKVNGRRLGRKPWVEGLRPEAGWGTEPWSTAKVSGAEARARAAEMKCPSDGALGLGLNQRPGGTGPTVKNHWGIVKGLGVEPQINAPAVPDRP